MSKSKPFRWIKPGDLRSFSIVSLSAKADGLAPVEGGTVLIRGALPGERVSARVVAVSQHRPEAFASLLQVEEAAPERVEPPCPHFARCGGCDLQHLAYEFQLEAKRVWVLDALSAHPSLASVEVSACVPCAEPLGYRHTAKWVLAHAGARGVLGAYARRSHEVIDIDGCRVHRPALERLGRALADALRARPWLSLQAQPKPGEAALRYAVARESSWNGALSLLLVASAPLPPADEEALVRALSLVEGLAGVSLHLNASPGDALFDPAGSTRVLLGAPTLPESLGGQVVEVEPSAFLQINPAQAARLREEALAWLAPAAGETALDLYAGVGEVSLALAARGARVIAIERSAAAVDAAARAATAAGATVEARVAEAAAAIGQVPAVALAYLNPPRAGAGPAVIEGLAALHPRRIAYTSCSPQSFARDAAQLAALGYVLQRVLPVDLFPHTLHVELLGLFSRAS